MLLKTLLALAVLGAIFCFPALAEGWYSYADSNTPPSWQARTVAFNIGCKVPVRSDSAGSYVASIGANQILRISRPAGHFLDRFLNTGHRALWSYFTSGGIVFQKTYPLAPPVQKPADICVNFNTGSMGEWTVNNLIPSFLKPGPGGKDDIYLSLLDAANESYLKVPPTFVGDWTPPRDCGRMLCYDVLITNDGIEGSSLNYPVGVHVYGANGSHFRYCPTTIPMTEPTGAHPGWHSVCAPIAEVMPPGWTKWPGSPGSWSDLIGNVTSIRFGFDVGSTQTEVLGIDNICLKTSCSPPPCK